MLLCVAGTALTVRAQKVTLNFRNAKLEQVFGRITEQTGYTFRGVLETGVHHTLALLRRANGR